MRKWFLLSVVLAVAVLAASSLVVAQTTDPFVGTWKLNVAKSTFRPGPAAAKEETIVVREVDADMLELVSSGTRTDGSPIAARYTWPRQGGVRSYSQGSPAEGVTVVDTSWIQNQDAYTISLQNGRQTALTHWVISKDGKTLAGTTTRVDVKGTASETHSLWEKQ
jgi:hypothetical protein